MTNWSWQRFKSEEISCSLRAMKRRSLPSRSLNLITKPLLSIHHHSELCKNKTVQQLGSASNAKPSAFYRHRTGLVNQPVIQVPRATTHYWEGLKCWLRGLVPRL